MPKKINWNKKLEDSGMEMRVEPGSTTSFIQLSNGQQLIGATAVRKFGRYLYTGWNLDSLYSTDKTASDAYYKQRVYEAHRKGGIAAQKLYPHIREIAKENCRKAKESGINPGFIKGGVGWSRGLSKDSHPGIRSISDAKQGCKNPMFGVVMSDEKKLEKSVTMQALIKSGKFTPKTNNRFTHFEIEYNGKWYRSSWEAAWQMMNPTHEYETQRISYKVSGKDRIYIVDFFDPESKTLIEIKPKSLTYSESFKAKKEWAEKWADENNGKYLVISQEYFIEHIERIMLSDLPDTVKNKLKGIR